MDFQDFKLKFKVVILTLRSHFGKINSTLTINKFSKINNAVLIFFPIDDNNCRIASYSFKTLNELKAKGVEVNICLSDKLQDLVNTISCNKITYLKNGNSIKKFNGAIDKSKRYDMIIDLNPKPIVDISEKINDLSAMYKIGFKSKISDSFYNIQLDLTDSKFLETSYGRIKNILQIS
tara:strand:- start:181 stop:714 length:534 start_codon:yes stop_codon:yes gene_type:complete